MADDLFDKAVDFTAIEDATLNAWLIAENNNLDDRAKAVLHAGLMAEHYRSLLSENVAQITVNQQQTLQRLRMDLTAELNGLAEDLAGKVTKRVPTPPQQFAIGE